MLHHYRYCGLALESDFPIPELPALSEADDSAEQLSCRQVTTLTEQEVMQPVSPVLAVGKTSVIWQLAGIARFRIFRSEALIEVEAAPEADFASIRLFLLHPVFVLSRLLHGDFMLQAACVAIDSQAMALVGPTACGKSTLAAVLHQRGHSLLSDGLLRIGKDENGTIMAFPQAPWLLLWPDAMKKLGVNSSTAQQVRPGLSLARIEATPICHAIPLRRILLMREQKGNDQDLFESVQSEGFSGIKLIRRFTAGEGWLHAHGMIPRHFQWSIDVAQACQREQLDLPWGWERFNDCVKQVEDWCRN